MAQWFRRWPDANVGIVPGEISNLIVLDVDPKHGGDASLERLEKHFGWLPTIADSKEVEADYAFVCSRSFCAIRAE